MLNKEFIDSSDDVEKIMAEQNEITVLDESIPSPAGIQTDATIVLPEIVSMPEYIRRHYEKDLIRACINQIYDLTLCVMYEGKLFHDVPGTGPIDYGEEEMVLTDGPTPLEWGEPKPFSFDRNVYSAILTEICKRCSEDPEHAAEYRLEAFESCPGLTELWPDPFLAKYDAADGAVLVRFKTDEHGVLQMAIDTVAK